MADFKKLSAVEAVNTVSDAATMLIEENGVIKRAPKTVVVGNNDGGGGGAPLVLVVDNRGDKPEWRGSETFEEIYNAAINGRLTVFSAVHNSGTDSREIDYYTPAYVGQINLENHEQGALVLVFGNEWEEPCIWKKDGFYFGGEKQE